MVTKIVDFQFMRATSAQWAVSNYVALEGEPLYAWDTGHFKIGDGESKWSELPGPYLTYDDMVDYIQNTGIPTIDARIGNMADLTTAEKDTVVGAINELDGDGIDYSSLYNNAKAG